MDAQLTRPTPYRIDAIDAPVSRIARLVTVLGAALVLLLCVIVVVRGLSGAFEAPVSNFFLVLTAVIGELLASAFRVVWLTLHPGARRRSRLLARLGLPAVCIFCVALALSLTAANGWAVGAVWLLVAGGELSWWYSELRAVQRRNSVQSAAVVAGCDMPGAVEVADQPADEEEEIGANVIQQMTRSRNGDGAEVISGVLRAEFAPGERLHNLHVAFCPPLAYDPAVVTHQLDGSPLTIKVAQSEIFGARIELRLAAAAGPADSATIYFEVQPR
ncbi:MAG: hypothetical protein ABI614_14700 [Planctomycetota bacterium]